MLECTNRIDLSFTHARHLRVVVSTSQFNKLCSIQQWKFEEPVTDYTLMSSSFSIFRLQVMLCDSHVYDAHMLVLLLRTLLCSCTQGRRDYKVFGVIKFGVLETKKSLAFRASWSMEMVTSKADSHGACETRRAIEPGTSGSQGSPSRKAVVTSTWSADELQATIWIRIAIRATVCNPHSKFLTRAILCSPDAAKTTLWAFCVLQVVVFAVQMSHHFLHSSYQLHSN